MSEHIVPDKLHAANYMDDAARLRELGEENAKLKTKVDRLEKKYDRLDGFNARTVLKCQKAEAENAALQKEVRWLKRKLRGYKRRRGHMRQAVISQPKSEGKT